MPRRTPVRSCPSRRLCLMGRTWLGPLGLALACGSGSDDRGSSLSNAGYTNVTSASSPGPGGDTSGTSDPYEDPTRPTSSGGGGGDSNSSNSSNSGVPTFECGNGVLDPNEECEGEDLDAQTCLTFGFIGGQLACTPACTYDTSMCQAAGVCGDGVIDANLGENCDCGAQGIHCAPAQLGNLGCANFDSPKGVPFGGGVLNCNSPAACSYNVDACTYCGDGQRNGQEDCDGAELGGQTCTGLGFDAGTLSCNVGCSYNTSACKSFSCGDGICQPGEDSCVCPQDCPENPNTCSPCECGGQGGPTCYCDIFCILNFDCCQGGPC